MNCADKNKKHKNNINVFVRIRPLTTDLRAGNSNVIEVKGQRELSVRSNLSENAHSRNFIVDKVFGPKSRQLDVYTTVAKPLVQEVIKGYNCTIFAYGQTGSGKTYTMQGGGIHDEDSVDTDVSWQDDEHAGIIPRVLAHLFDELRLLSIEYSVRVSYYELYNEDIYDLLSPPEDNSKLRLYEDCNKKGSVIVQSATEAPVSCKSEVYSLLEKGAIKRKVATTLMNAQSRCGVRRISKSNSNESRSHTVFCITVHTKDSSIDGEDLIKIGKLYLVDLAGSENINKSGATDKRAREAFNINQSLLTLGRCIVALAENRGHVPYRESKLTRLLQDSLGGCTKTSLIATINPSFNNVDESLNTLEYANRAKHITNKPEINMKMTKKALMKDYEDKINKLRKDLDALRLGTGFYIDKENYEELIKQLEIQKEEVSEKISQIRALKTDMEKMEIICDELKISVVQHREELFKKNEVINTLEVKIDEASKKILTLKEHTEQQEFILEKRKESEVLLQTTAKKLLSVADLSTNDIEKLHLKLSVLSELDESNKKICEKYLQTFTQNVNRVQEKLQEFNHEECAFFKNLSGSLQKFGATQNKFSIIFDEFNVHLTNLIDGITENLKHEDEKLEEYDRTSKEAASQFKESSRNAKILVKDKMAEIKTCLNEVNEQMQNQSDNFFNFRNDFEAKVSNMEHNSVELFETIFEIRNVMLKDINNQNIEQKSNIDILQDLIVMHHKQQSNLHESFDKHMSDAFGALQKAQDVMSRALDESKTNVDSMKNKLDKTSAANSKLTHILEKYNNLSEVHIDNALSATSNSYKELHSDVVKECNLMMQGFKCSEDTIDSMDQTIDNCEKIIHGSLENQESTVIEDLKVQNQLQIESCELTKSILNNISDKITEIFTKSINDKNSADVNMTENLEHAQEVVDKNEILTRHVSSIISSETRNFLEGFRNLFTHNIKEYKVTGQTPIKKQYKFPKCVPSPKSKEDLIMEYYSMKENVESNEQMKKASSESSLLHMNRENISDNLPKDIDMRSKISPYPGDIMIQTSTEIN